MLVCPWAVDELWDEPSLSTEETLNSISLGDRAKPSLCLLLLQLDVLNNVSSSEDIKPLPGLPGIGNMNYPSTSPGSLAKHICAICGDRSSGRKRPSSGRALYNDSCPDALKACIAVNVVINL